MEVVREVPYDTPTQFGKEGKEYATLGSYEGYVEVSDLHLKTNATEIEKNHIRNILTTGIFINEPLP